jgi:hypothetical protein|tara:strand:- start:71 stop:373 length:303 start_codon:yes stop_codon:yes gene_type:complete
MNDLQKAIIKRSIGRLDHLSNKATLAFGTDKNSYQDSWGESQSGYQNDTKTSKAFRSTTKVITKLTIMSLTLAGDGYHPDDATADLTKLQEDIDKMFTEE